MDDVKKATIKDYTIWDVTNDCVKFCHSKTKHKIRKMLKKKIVENGKKLLTFSRKCDIIILVRRYVTWYMKKNLRN